MREILFRAKRVDDGEWIEGYYLDKKTSMADFPCIAPFRDSAYDDDNDWEVDIETVGQFTGLTDKNGTKIFEGDILKGLYANGNAEVRMINGSWVGYAGKGWTDIGYVVDRVEVIGNIHDNPELLNK